MNLEPYKVFKDLKTKYPVRTIRVFKQDILKMSNQLNFPDPLEYVKAEFKSTGIEVYRVIHDYKSLNSQHPKLGLVFLAGDSVVEDYFEVHALLGHNAKEVSDAT